MAFARDRRTPRFLEHGRPFEVGVEGAPSRPALGGLDVRAGWAGIYDLEEKRAETV